MAYKLFPFHNLDASVGKGAINRADDVRLVQALIEICIGASRGLEDVRRKCKELGGPEPGKKLAVNGVYSDDLAAYIEMIQRHLKKAGKSVTVDGKVTPVPVSRGFDLNTRTRAGGDYTLLMLNRTAVETDSEAFLELGRKIGVNFGIPM
ncbi:hypothetical protein F183_A02680 [Bryobacterales bacterium F-183]|nr:hypothetical protein F183_A02680 [Bryobacterales bacterium F-183]